MIAREYKITKLRYRYIIERKITLPFFKWKRIDRIGDTVDYYSDTNLFKSYKDCLQIIGILNIEQ